MEIIINEQLFDETFYGYLKNPEERVRYIMGIVSRVLANYDKPVSPKNPMILNGNSNNAELFRYLWTACLSFGINARPNSFDEHSMIIRSFMFPQSTEFSWLTKKMPALTPVRFKFAKDSLYNTIFKPCIENDLSVLDISKTALLFKDISGELPIQEQVKLWLQQCANGNNLPVQNDREEEKPDYAAARYLTELVRRLYDYKKKVTAPERYYLGLVSDYSKMEQFQAIDRLLIGLCRNKDVTLLEEDLRILHYGALGPLITDWEKLAHIPIDKTFPEKIAACLTQSRGIAAYTLALLYEEDGHRQNALNYYCFALRQNNNEAFNLFKQRGEENDANALYFLAINYYHPKGDITEALCLCLKAVELGSDDAKRYIEKSEFPEMLQPREEKPLIALDSLEEEKDEPIEDDLFEDSSDDIIEVDLASSELARQYESEIKQHPKADSKAFNAYFISAKSGNTEALEALERLAPRMSAKKQQALSELYTGFFANRDKAQFWQQKALESAPFPFIDNNP